MPDRRPAITAPETEEAVEVRHRHAPSTAMADRLSRPHSREEAEERYVAARDVWVTAMGAANSGSSSDMAALAIAQEAYEAALAERERWASSPRTPVSIDADRPTGIDVVVGQELSWRRVHESDEGRKRPTGLRRLLRRITNR